MLTADYTTKARMRGNIVDCAASDLTSDFLAVSRLDSVERPAYRDR